MYQQQKNNFKDVSKARLLINSTLISLVGILVIPGIIDLVSIVVFKSKGDSMISLASTISMILSVFLSALLFCKVSKIEFEDLGWQKKV